MCSVYNFKNAMLIKFNLRRIMSVLIPAALLYRQLTDLGFFGLTILLGYLDDHHYHD